MLSEVRVLIEEYKGEYNFLQYSKDKVKLGNKIATYFNDLQKKKVSLIFENEVSGFFFLKEDLKTLSENQEEQEIRNIVFRKETIKNNGKYGWINMKDLEVKDFYEKFSVAISIERKYYIDEEILEIIDLQKEIISIVIDYSYYLLKEKGIQILQSVKNHSVSDYMNEAVSVLIKKLYSYNSERMLFSSYLFQSLNEFKQYTINKEINNYDNEMIVNFDDYNFISEEKEYNFNIDENLISILKDKLNESDFKNIHTIINSNKEIEINDVLKNKVYSILRESKYL